MTTSPDRLARHFTDLDAQALSDLLDARADEGVLPLEAVDGLFCAAVVGPESVGLDELMPVVLQGAAPAWADAADTTYASALLAGLLAHVGRRVARDPDDQALPYFALPEDADELDEDGFAELGCIPGANWAIGFMGGVGLREDAWGALVDTDEDTEADLDFIAALLPEGEDDEDDADVQGDGETADTPREPLRWQADADASEDDAEEDPEAPLTMRERLEALGQVPDVLHALNLTRLDRLNSQAPVRREAKVGRNDPCPCGSGAKYKKCHGANGDAD